MGYPDVPLHGPVPGSVAGRLRHLHTWWVSEKVWALCNDLQGERRQRAAPKVPFLLHSVAGSAIHCRQLMALHQPGSKQGVDIRWPWGCHSELSA